jgi:hypothetical protein
MNAQHKQAVIKKLSAGNLADSAEGKDVHIGVREELALMGVLAQVFTKTVEHLASAFPAQVWRLDSIDTIEVGALLGPR